jgi:hypothetical protein
MEIINKIFAVATPLIILLAVRNTPTIKGIIGELRVNFLLKRKLDKSKYLIINDIILNNDNDSTQIDHVIVSEYGVFVVETKNMNGWIFGDKNNKNWTQQIFLFKSKFQNPLRQNYKHIKFLQDILQINENKIYSLIVFTGKSEFKTEIPANVMNVNNLIKHIKYKDTILLEKNEIISIYTRLVNIKKKNSFKGRMKHIYMLKYNKFFYSENRKYSNINLIYEVIIKNDLFKTICVTLLLIISLYTLVSSNHKFFIDKFYTLNNLFLIKANKTVTQIKSDKKEKVTNEEKTELKLTKQNKFKGDIYSWINKDGKKEYSNVGFPKDEPYTDGKIEINQ